MTIKTTKDLWDLRRRNIRILLALKGVSASKAAAEAGLSINTLTRFLSGKNASISQSTLETLANYFDLTSAIVLDLDNPINDPRALLLAEIERLDAGQAHQVLDYLRQNFAED